MTEFVMISVPFFFQFYYYIIECINLKYNFEWPQQGEFG